MKKYLIEYSLNNSGGRWWLENKDWDALKKSKWDIAGHGMFIYNNEGNHVMTAKGLPKLKKINPEYYSYAFKRFNSIKEALCEFEKITGADITAEGCNCCGTPHSFFWNNDKGDRGYCSGESCSEYLLNEDLTTLTKRQLLERLNSK